MSGADTGSTRSTRNAGNAGNVGGAGNADSSGGSGSVWSRERAWELAAASGWPPLDLSLGVPAEPAPAISSPGPRESRAPAAYPPSAGTGSLRTAAAGYLERRFGVTVPASAVAACAGAKEFISTVPSLLRLARRDRSPRRDVALIPALGYPPYAFGARLAGLDVHRVPVDAAGRMDLGRVPDHLAARALYLWVNSPANPAGTVEPRPDEIVGWGREHGVVVLSDEVYAELTWDGAPRTALAAGLDGVLAVHGVAKRSNAPGLRVGFYAGDPALVSELLPSRRDAGLIAAGDSQRAAADLLGDDAHAAGLRARTAHRLAGLVEALNDCGLRCAHPEGGPFVWLAAPGGDGVEFAYRVAARAGLVIAPGIAYGPSGGGHVRVAAVHDPQLLRPRLAALGLRTRERSGDRKDRVP
ncbi:pyridoxal phosphate-dependent aminotransferase [Streptosporangium sp. NPDC002524]|uniref:pyridoxal phosphate-dependent aminotransferase n=1 Tax=Streptosporangium sp. NPDC002524 TaxID=3154537 RepID=UPI003316B4D1